jgi:hypothetical protein
MELWEFKIGTEFECGGMRWRCTDVGSRVVLAIELDPELDVSWFNGPPYAVAECVFDEYDRAGCTAVGDARKSLSP